MLENVVIAFFFFFFTTLRHWRLLPEISSEITSPYQQSATFFFKINIRGTFIIQVSACVVTIETKMYKNIFLNHIHILYVRFSSWLAFDQSESRTQ